MCLCGALRLSEFIAHRSLLPSPYPRARSIFRAERYCACYRNRITQKMRMDSSLGVASAGCHISTFRATQ